MYFVMFLAKPEFRKTAIYGVWKKHTHTCTQQPLDDNVFFHQGNVISETSWAK